MFESCLAEVITNLRSYIGPQFSFKDEQVISIHQLFSGKDLIAVLPTGFGKSLIFQALVLLKERQHGRKGCILVITPLNSIIKDQILEVSSLGITACSLVEHIDNLEDLLSGKYSIVYASAECATDKRFLSHLKKDSFFKSNLLACVVDETHTVETWTGLR